MKKSYWLIAISLLLSLFIYLFYRTEKTVINQLFISVFSCQTFMQLRQGITSLVPLNEYTIYSLPEGLWVFCITLTSKMFYIKAGNFKIDLLFFPLFFSIGLELCQLLHFTNGRFDWWDIAFSIFFWAIANYIADHKIIQQNALNPFTQKSLICLSSYLVVYLAHVWK